MKTKGWGEQKDILIRPHANHPVPMDTPHGQMIPPDFRDTNLALGCKPEPLIRSIGVGITHSGMPGWSESLNPKDLWSIVHYVQRLCEAEIP